MREKMKARFDSFVRFLRSSKRTTVLVVFIVVTTLIITSLISLWLDKVTNLDLPSVGTIRTLGVEAYWDQDLTDKIDQEEKIDWGTIWLASSQNISIYLRSISNFETTLHLTMANLTFYNSNQTSLYPPIDISNHMNLDWTYSKTKVRPGEILRVTLILETRISDSFILYLIDNDARRFSFDIIISTSEYS